MFVTIAGEGALDLAIARRILAHFGHDVAAAFDKKGKEKIDANLSGYFNASRVGNWFILRDLDAEPCVLDVLNRIAPNRQAYPNAHLRLCVRAIESWLLADRIGFAQYFAVRQALVPLDPEAIIHPKQALLNVVAQSRHRSLRDRVLPRPGSGRSVGPEYNAVLTDFAQSTWSIARAAEASSSLRRASTRIGEMQEPVLEAEEVV